MYGISTHISSSFLFLPIVNFWTVALSRLSDKFYVGTGKFQPADVGQNRVIKHRLKQSQLRYLVNTYSNQITSGLTPEQVKFSTSKPELRDASVAGIVETYEFMSSATGRELIKKVRRGWSSTETKS